MTIHWLFPSPHPDSDHDHDRSALVDLVPSILVCLDYDSTRQLSSVNRVAAHSSVRAAMLERSVLQLSPSSIVVHNMLRNMALRSHLHTFEIRDCLAAPYHIRDLPALLASARRVKFVDEPTLDREVLDEVHRKGRGGDLARKLGQTEYVRHVRRRLNEEHRSNFPRIFPDGSPEVAEELEPWFLALNPASVVDLDFGRLRVDNFYWIPRFPGIKKLQFMASSEFTFDNYLNPLGQATSLEELVIVQLERGKCSDLATLTSLRRLELRCAPNLKSIEFLRNFINLERLVLTEVPVSDLSPLLRLRALKDLTLDSIGLGSFVSFDDESSPSVPAFPTLESLQVVFTMTSMDRLLRHCPNLKQLHLCQTKLDNWKPLRSLRLLEQVSISVDGIDDWSPLTELHHLERLALESTQGLVRCQPLGNSLKKLTQVISPPWDDYTPLVKAAPALAEVHLLGWRARDSSSLSALKDATCLRTLRIAFTPGPVELSTVGDLQQLQSLELWNASTVTIDFLRGLQNLVELNVSTPFGAAVKIINFAPLTELKALQTLILSGRREFKNANLEILTELPRLKNLDVADSGVTPSFLKKLSCQYNTRRSKFTSQDEQAKRQRLADTL